MAGTGWLQSALLCALNLVFQVEFFTITHSGWTCLRTLIKVVSGLFQDGTVKLYLLCNLVASLIKVDLSFIIPMAQS